jgi:hypothetical protein
VACALIGRRANRDGIFRPDMPTAKSLLHTHKHAHPLLLMWIDNRVLVDSKEYLQ